MHVLSRLRRRLAEWLIGRTPEKPDARLLPSPVPQRIRQQHGFSQDRDDQEPVC